MDSEIPKIIKDVGFDFDWNEAKVWKLNYPVEEIETKELIWHFDLPFHWHDGGVYNLKSKEIIDNPQKYKEEYERTMNCDLKYPIDIMMNKGKWLILDGLHRLMKAKILGMKKVKVRKIPRSEIPNITKENSYDKIIPTAWLVAYRRTFSDIPFSKEIFEELDKLRERKFIEISNKMLASELSPQYEARQKIIDKYLQANNTKQIIELASGFSARGMIISKDSEITYVEFDLPKVIEDKEKIVNSIFRKLNEKRKNLFFEKGSALDYNALSKAVKHFKQKPITIINEGFLRYLNFKEKEMVAKNIHKLLKKYGGCWITSDITLKKLLKVEEDLKVHNKTIEKMTGINVDENRFENEEQAKKFFEDIGFSIERHSFMEVKNKLTSPKKLNLSDKDIDKLIESAVVYVMRVKE